MTPFRYQRHSNSIDIEKYACNCGGRLQPQFKLPTKRAGKGNESPSKAVTTHTMGNSDDVQENEVPENASGDVNALALALKVTGLD